MRKQNSQSMMDSLRDLLSKGTARTQEDLKISLQKKGFEVNQSKISRLLRKLGAIKVLDSQGEIIYRLPQDPAPPSTYTSVSHLVVEVMHNEMLIVIRTSPGSASLIARLIDFQAEKIGCIGTVAGDDTILVVPSSVKTLQDTINAIKSLLVGSSLNFQ
jgi:transcriptional regulator of arginine metabolism